MERRGVGERRARVDRWRVASTVFGAFPPRRLHGFGARQLAIVTLTGSVEWVRRHQLLLAAIEGLRAAAGGSPLRLLDFGGAAGSLSKAIALHALSAHYRVIACDVDEGALAIAPRLPVSSGCVRVGTGAALPFADGAFDVAVSSDVFEHIPRDARAPWVRELDRVARFGQVHTVPCRSGDGRFAGGEADDRLQAWHEGAFGRKDRFTAEHQEQGLPTFEELRALFPEARLTGFANVERWLEMVKDQLSHPTTWGRARNGWRFLKGDQATADVPPWKCCLVDALRAPDEALHR